MIPFSMQVKGYRAYQNVLKIFSIHMPFPKPTLFSGPDSAYELCGTIADMGIDRVLVVTDAVLVKIGLVSDILEELKKKKVRTSVYDGVEPDPKFDQIEAGLSMLRKDDCTAVLAVGGGSSIDAAKMIAARATNEKSLHKFKGLFRVFKTPLPLFAIPTTAGTGSEVSLGAVITEPETGKKVVVIDPKLMPVAAALDGKLMTSLPPHITAATGMDALSHAVEAYVSANAIPDTDKAAIAATRLIMKNLPEAFRNGEDVTVRQNMAIASYWAGMAMTRAGVGYVHAISHNFGGLYHTPHGLGNAIVMPHMLDYYLDTVADRLADLAIVSGIDKAQQTTPQLAEAFVAHIRSMNESFGIPSQLADLKAKDIPGITKSALHEAHTTYAVPKYMDKATCNDIVSKMLPEE